MLQTKIDHLGGGGDLWDNFIITKFQIYSDFKETSLNANKCVQQRVQRQYMTPISLTCTWGGQSQTLEVLTSSSLKEAQAQQT